MNNKDILTKLIARGCIQDSSHPEELKKLLAGPPISFYCGFDPTASSLHVGSMLPLVIMRRLQEAGHKPIVLLGSATGMIGDPSGKSEERKLLDEETLQENVKGIEKQIKFFLSDKGDNAYKLVKNDEWLKPLSMIDFLRDVGKHFSVNMMMSKDSVKARFESREQGISYTEFSYMLLQSYDFYFLNKNHNCRLQVGGSDQWGNITAGLELIRRKNNAEHPQAYGMTFPLLMTSAGTKFGKTEKGAVWLDSERTSAYHFFQFWLNSADQDVIKYLNLFSSGTEQEILEIKNSLESAPEKREAQQYLAKNLTTLLHGESETNKAIQASRVLFGESMESLDFKTLSDIFSEVPSTTVLGSEISTGVSLNDLLVKCEVAQSKGAAKRLIEGGGIYLNNNKAGDVNLTVGLGHFIEGKLLVIRSGKKNYHLVRVGSN